MKLEIKVISAKNIGKKNAYAKIYIDGEQSTEKQTPVDRRGKKNPKWDHTVAYLINSLDVKDNCTKLVIRVCNENMSGEEEFVGEVNVKFKELFKRAGGERKTVKYKLKNEFGRKSKGNLKFSYKFLKEKNSCVNCGCFCMTTLKILSLGLAGSSSS